MNEQILSNLEDRLGRRVSFLEFNYIKAMAAGENHSVYCVGNDLSDNKQLCNQLRATYQKYQELNREENAD